MRNLIQTLGVMLACASIPSFAQESFDLEQFAIRELTEPSLPEWLALADKNWAPIWRRLNEPQAYMIGADRYVLALTLGIIVADGHFAILAQNGQGFRNVMRDFQSASSALGLVDLELERFRRLKTQTDQRRWSVAAGEWDALYRGLRVDFERMRDQRLMALVTFAMWVRTLESLASAGETATDHHAVVLEQGMWFERLARRLAPSGAPTESEDDSFQIAHAFLLGLDDVWAQDGGWDAQRLQNLKEGCQEALRQLTGSPLPAE